MEDAKRHLAKFVGGGPFPADSTRALFGVIENPSFEVSHVPVFLFLNLLELIRLQTKWPGVDTGLGVASS